MSITNNARAEFLRGATRPSAGALLGALCVTAGLIALCAWKITPHFVATHPGYFEFDDRDEFAYLTARGLQIAEQPPDGTDVVIIGDSAIREAVTDPDDLEKLIDQRLGKPVHVKFLAAGGLTQWNMVALTDIIRGHIKGIVLLEISPVNIGMDPSAVNMYERMVAVESNAFREEVKNAGQSAPPNTGNYFLDNYHFFIARPVVLYNIFHGPPPFTQHLVEHKNSWRDEDWQKFYNRMWGWREDYREVSPNNFGIYERMIARLRQNPDIKVALYRTAENPRIYTEWPNKGQDKRAIVRYDKDMKVFIRRNHIPMLDIVSEIHAQPDDFWDSFHMREDAARQRYTQAMADHVAELLGAPPATQEAGLRTEDSGLRGSEDSSLSPKSSVLSPSTATASGPLAPVLRGEGGGEGSGDKVRHRHQPTTDPSPQPSPLGTGERGQEDQHP